MRTHFGSWRIRERARQVLEDDQHDWEPAEEEDEEDEVEDDSLPEETEGALSLRTAASVYQPS